MPYWRLYYHLVWSTKNREPLVVPDIEEELYEQIRRKVKALKGEPLKVNGIADHTHLVTTIPPTIAVAKFVGEVKGNSSFHINHLPGNSHAIEWQRGYGAVSCNRKDLDRLLDYVVRQKDHHAAGKVWESLERADEEEEENPSWVLRDTGEEYDAFS